MDATTMTTPRWVVIGTGMCFFALFLIALAIGDPQGARAALFFGVVLTLTLYIRRLGQLLAQEQSNHEDTKRELNHVLGLTLDGKGF